MDRMPFLSVGEGLLPQTRIAFANGEGWVIGPVIYLAWLSHFGVGQLVGQPLLFATVGAGHFDDQLIDVAFGGRGHCMVADLSPMTGLAAKMYGDHE